MWRSGAGEKLHFVESVSPKPRRYGATVRNHAAWRTVTTRSDVVVWACLRTAYPAPKLITWKVMAAQVPMLRLGQQIMEGWSWRRLRAHTHQEG